MDSFTGCIGTAGSNKKLSSKENVVINANEKIRKRNWYLNRYQFFFCDMRNFRQFIKSTVMAPMLHLRVTSP